MLTSQQTLDIYNICYIVSSIYIAIFTYIYIYTYIHHRVMFKKHKASIVVFVYKRWSHFFNRLASPVSGNILDHRVPFLCTARALGIVCVCCGFSCIKERGNEGFEESVYGPTSKHYCCSFCGGLFLVVLSYQERFLKVAMPQDLQCHNSELVS